ncbi:MAG: PadR family transcriptional regulator [Turicibacter sp.]|nr:PadR family transcriptional regulator [Turicibacter sp.]
MARNEAIETEQLTDSFYYILIALLVPRHGYLIMKYIEELSGGDFVMGPATLYTIIKKLLKAELITPHSEVDRKKIYLITDKGRELLVHEVKRREKMVRHGIEALEGVKP